MRALRHGLKELLPEEREVIRLRFWGRLEIEEIAVLLRKSWEEIDHMIESSLRKLRASLGGGLS